MYLYNKITGQYFNTDDYIVLDSDTMQEIEAKYSTQLNNNYGYIHIQDNKPIYAPYEVNISVDSNNDISIANGNHDAVITVEMFENIKSAKENGKLVKYYKGEVHYFDFSEIKQYNPITNEYLDNIELIKAHIKSKLNKCEDDVRQHGYWYNLWDNELLTYVQPFRIRDDNDLQVINELKSKKYEVRQFKLFSVASDDQNIRLTAPETLNWLRGKAVTDLFLEYHSNSIMLNSGYVKLAIENTIKEVDSITNIKELYNINTNYISMVIHNLDEIIHKISPELEEMRLQLINEFKALRITPLPARVGMK